MNRYFYPAIFTKEGNKYNVNFIDFKDIFTFGDNFEDAYHMAQDALYNMLSEYKDNLPKPTYDYRDLKIGFNEFIIVVCLNILEHEKKILEINI